jgi:hypothetical protein
MCEVRRQEAACGEATGAMKAPSRAAWWQLAPRAAVDWLLPRPSSPDLAKQPPVRPTRQGRAPDSATAARTALNLKLFIASMPQSTRKASTPITAPMRIDSSHFHVSARR